MAECPKEPERRRDDSEIIFECNSLPVDRIVQLDSPWETGTTVLQQIPHSMQSDNEHVP